MLIETHTLTLRRSCGFYMHIIWLRSERPPRKLVWVVLRVCIAILSTAGVCSINVVIHMRSGPFILKVTFLDLKDYLLKLLVRWPIRFFP